MEGPPENPGVNLRALERLFEVRSAFARPLARFHATRLHCRVTRHVAAPQVRAARRGAKEIAIFASAIEIYNEAVRDLLSKDPQVSCVALTICTPPRFPRLRALR